MERINQKNFVDLLNRFLSAEISDVIVSLPVKGHSLLDDFPRFVFMDSGELDCDAGQNGEIRTVHLREHSVLFGLKGASTGCSPKNTSEGDAFTIGFFPEYIRFVYYSFRSDPPKFFFFHTTEPLCGAGVMALESLRSIVLDPAMRPAQIFLIKSILEMSKRQLVKGEGVKIGKSSMTWQKVEAYVDQHLTDETLSRRAIAEEFRMNECYLSSLCQKKTNHTLNEFIIRKKLAYAILLLEQNKSIGEIADECGFHQTGYFIQVFRKIYGVPPGKYRTNFTVVQ